MQMADAGETTVQFLCYIITVPMIFTQCSPCPKLWKPLLPGNCAGIQRAYVFAIFTGCERNLHVLPAGDKQTGIDRFFSSL